MSPSFARLLVSRGITDPDTAERFLDPRPDHLHSPFLLEQMPRAVERLKQAQQRGEKVCIYGDYDVDGATSVSLLLGVFRHLGMACDYYIPQRMEEGYGMNCAAIEEIHAQGASLIVSVDCGVTSVAEVERANALGMDVIVTDHHEPDVSRLPPAHAILNPKLSERYPFDALAGVGIAFKLAHALLGGEHLPAILERQLDLVALGTVVDVTPLVDENRTLVALGLPVLNRRERLGIRALCEVARLDESRPLNAYSLAFVLGPRLNAAGRLDTARKAVELLTTDVPERAAQLARELDEENTRRREIEQQILEQAEIKLKREVNLERARSIVLAEEGWHRGVIGIVASRLVERHHRPTILIALEGEEGHGSGRSIESFNLYEGLVRCQETLERFGGHQAAAGLTILKKHIPKFRHQFAKVTAEQLTDQDLIPRLDIDLVVTPEDLSEQLVEEIERMRPFGLGNPRPVLAIRGVSLQGPARTMGQHQNHLMFRIADGRRVFRAVGWNMAPYQILLQQEGTTIDIAFYLEINEYQGFRSLQLNVRDIQVAERSRQATICYPETQDGLAQIIDQRGVYDKMLYLRELLHRGERTVLYVRSDAALEQIRREFTDHVISYYGAHQSREARQESLLRFNQGDVNVLASSLTVSKIATPRHIVFCHPVPNQVMFVRRCQPAFQEDGFTAIHLIFHPRDIEAMHASLRKQYPTRPMLVKLYRYLRALSQRYGDMIPVEALVEKSSFPWITVQQGLAIFAELEFLTWQAEASSVRLLPPPTARKDLADSPLFRKGEQIRQNASQFGEILNQKSARELWGVLHHEAV